MAEAQQKLKQEHNTFSLEHVQEYLAGDPETQAAYNILVNQDPKLALKMAWKQAKGNVTGRSAFDPVAQVAATSPPKRQAPARNEPQERANRIEALRKEAEETGIWEKYYAERLKGTSADRTSEFDRVPTVRR